MRIALTILIGLLPAVAMAQIQVNADTSFTISDENCSDYASEQEAQGRYDYAQAMSEAFGEGREDPFGLDADGDGQPCESIEVAKREVLGDSVWIDFRLEPLEIKCVTGRTVTFDALREQLIEATRDSVAYRGEGGIWPRYECVHIISQLVSQ